MPGWCFGYEQDDLNLFILRMFEGSSADATNMTMPVRIKERFISLARTAALLQ